MLFLPRARQNDYESSQRIVSIKAIDMHSAIRGGMPTSLGIKYNAVLSPIHRAFSV
jgi:hypothetical protein